MKQIYDMLKLENIKILAGVKDWKEAIYTAVQPLKFKEDGYDVRILVTLAATDAESHMEVLQAMSELFESKESTQRVLDASNEKEIYDLFVGAV